MILIFKIHCVLWLFMGTLASALGFKEGVTLAMAIGLPLVVISITGILGLRIAPMAACVFWIGAIVTSLASLAMGTMESLGHVLMLCLLYAFFAMISFLSYDTEGLPEEDQSETADQPEQADEEDS